MKVSQGADRLFGLFRKKLPPFDLTEGNLFVPAGLDILGKGDGKALGELYASLPPADRLHFLDGVGRLSEIDVPLPPASQHPAMAAITGGLRYVWAHELRGFATADLTNGDQAHNMYEMASLAREALDEAATLTPGDSALHAYRIRTFMLAGGGDIEEIVRDLSACGEQNVLAEMARLNYLAPKWHGSVEEMHAMADALIAAPPNAAFLGLKARAFIEEWLYETAMNDDHSAAAALKKRAATPEFKRQLADLDDRFFALLGSGPALTAAEAQFAHNQFACLFIAFINKDRVKRHLAALGKPWATPWGYLASDIPAYIARLRKELGLPRG